MTEKNPFFGATFAERKAARESEDPQVEPKQVDAGGAEDKSVQPAETKRVNRKKS